MNEWLNEWMNECTNERTNEWMNEWRKEWMNEWKNEWMKECRNEGMKTRNEETNERRNQGTKERRNERMKEGTNERANEGRNERTNEGRKEGMNDWNRALATVSCTFCRPYLAKMWNRALGTVSCTFCRPHLPKGLRAPQFFTILCDQLHDDDVVDIWNRALATSLVPFYVRLSSGYGLVHILSASSSKGAPRPSVFTIFMWNRALPTVSCTFCRPHLPKVLRTWLLFYVFM